jgi:hypothetical protein
MPELREKAMMIQRTNPTRDWKYLDDVITAE